MKDELPFSKLKRRSLDERFSAHPQSYARLQAIVDMMEASVAAGCSADEADERAIDQIQKLGQALLSDWAEEAQQQSLEQAQAREPQASKHVKMNSKEVDDLRRGQSWRPLCQYRAVVPRGYAGWVWLQTAEMAGLTEQTQGHGLSDGARWILDKFTDSFGERSRTWSFSTTSVNT